MDTFCIQDVDVSAIVLDLENEFEFVFGFKFLFLLVILGHQLSPHTYSHLLTFLTYHTTKFP